MREDTDEMYDELFDKHGKVVFSRKDKKPATAEVDDDADSLSCKLINDYMPNLLVAFTMLCSHV